MERDYSLKMARSLLRLHGLTHWKLETSEQTGGAYGICHKRKKKITLNEAFIKHCDASQLVDLVLHEIAHALVGISHYHDKVWKQKCVEIGTKPYASLECCVPTRYQAICGVCERFFTRSRRPPLEFYLCVCTTKPRIQFQDVSQLENPEKHGYRSYK